MIAIDAKELWRQIPPEEKFELIAKSHSRGFLCAFTAVVIASTVAVGLKAPWLIWSSLVISPLIFQFAAGKAWRALRPKLMLEHLAVRSAARRYAFAHRSQDLGLVTVFRGTLEEQFSEENISAALEATVENVRESAVWVALFNDAVVMVAERIGGAELKFVHLINDELEIKSESPVSGKEYAPDHVVFLQYPDYRTNQARKFKLTSKYPAALIVFEKKLLQLKSAAKELTPNTQNNSIEAEFDHLWDKATNAQQPA